MPLVFSAPHGGALTPSEIPDRVDNGTDPNFTTVTDSNTEAEALTVRQVFCNYFGHCPHVIICQLKRTKIDCNRSLAQGVYNNNVYATQAWNEFNNFINSASNLVAAQSSHCFYIDLHGQGHAIERLELGYLLTADQLTNTDTVLNGGSYRIDSSIRTLATLVSSTQSITFSQILRGANSFGGLMAARGYPSIPSPTMPNPGNGTNPIVYPGDQNSYFDGGYNTAVHSSQSGGGPVDGLQIEANYTGVRDSATSLTNFSIALAQVLDYFFTNYYGKDLRLSAPSIWSAGSGSWATPANWSVTLPVSGNYLQFSGAGGAVNNNLAALTTGTGRVYSIIFGTNATGSYGIYGNAVSLVSGVTNSSPFNQTISNALTFLSPCTFAASNGPLLFAGPLTNAGFNLTVLSTSNTTFSGIIGGTGGLSKSGAGSLILAAANTYSGPSTNLSGTLLISNSTGSATGSGSVYVASNSTLAGSGTIGGPVKILGAIAPGNPLGTLTLTNGLDLTSGVYVWTLAANSTSSPGVNFDQIVLSGGSLAIGTNSVLGISFSNSATAPATNVAFWQTGHSWTVISLGPNATNLATAGFVSITNGTFTAGRFNSSLDLQGNVLLNYLPTPQPVISPSLPGAGTSSVTISWSATAGVNYQVQYSTNLSAGSWQPLATVLAGGTNASLVDTNAPLGKRFYRIAIP